jgi:hypothetical protein
MPDKSTGDLGAGGYHKYKVCTPFGLASVLRRSGIGYRLLPDSDPQSVLLPFVPCVGTLATTFQPVVSPYALLAND